MIVLGLTGSVGMGKSTVAAMFRERGVSVHDADSVVHALLGPDGAAVREVEKAFPELEKNGGAIDRRALGAIVFADRRRMRELEHILHPLVRREEEAFLTCQRQQGAPLAVLDIPLLYETGADKRCDAVAVVSAPVFIQRPRVLARSGMTPARFRAILAWQMPDAQKRLRADHVIETGVSLAHTRRQVRRLIRALLQYAAEKK